MIPNLIRLSKINLDYRYFFFMVHLFSIFWYNLFWSEVREIQKFTFAFPVNLRSKLQWA